MPDDPADRQAALRLSSGGRPWLILLRGRWGGSIDRLVIRLTGFSLVTLQYAIARKEAYQPTLILTVTGKRSGLPRSHAMVYYADGGRLLVVGSHGGGPHDPDWIWNLRADPHAWVRVGHSRHSVIAAFASGEERDRLWRAIVAARPSVARYQERAGRFGRQLPLVILTRPGGNALI
jgi:deazaflavin-dependent oxidoreductase (nitroreductase family)